MILYRFVVKSCFTSLNQFYFKLKHKSWKSERDKFYVFFAIFFPLYFLSSKISLAQGELDLQPRLLYKNEKSGGIYLNSNGFGAGYRFGQRIDARLQNIYEIDFSIIKHPKEVKISNNFYSNRSFVFGKENAFMELRGMIGRQNEIFRKNDRGGIAVRFFYTGGPAVGLLKPVYYEVLYLTSDPHEFYLKTEKYSSSINHNVIYGRASFFKGVKEVSLVPGASVKTGFGFEYSKMDIVLHSIEAGVSMSAFVKKIPIMATERNDFLFLNLFISYRFGKYIDVSEAALARRSSEAEKQDRKIRRGSIRQQKKMDKEENYY